jgi:DNA-binding winged helix-turn-helix (wHTH) protein/Tol biopolymer transport system component
MSPAQMTSAPILRFGVFEVDLRSAELRKAGVRVALQEQPFRVLVRLLERTGEVVSRDDLRQQLWPADTFVDFDHGLNTAIKRLRDALGDSADTPRFIETLPRRGYRWIAPVGPLTQPAAETNAGVTFTDKRLPEGRVRRGLRINRRVLALTLFCAAVLTATFWSLSRRWRSSNSDGTAQPVLVRLTANPAEMSITSAQISPDGRHLALADPTGLQVQALDSRTTHRLADTKGMNVYGWTPDSANVLTSECDEWSCSGWVISLVGQERHRVGAVWSRDDVVRVAPDGVRHLRLAWSTKTLMVDPVTGASPQLLASGDIIAANWSADGRRVLFVRVGVPAIESVSADGGKSVEVFRAPKNQLIGDAIELADRSILMAMMPPGSAPGPTTEIELWKLQVDPTGIAREPPRRLTYAAASFSDLSASTNGERVAFLNTLYESDVYHASADLGAGVMGAPRRLTLSDRDDLAFDWTTDSRTVLLWSTRNGTSDVFKQPIDSDVAEPFLIGPGDQGYPGVTSDGRWVLYVDGSISGDDSIMRVPLSGGAPVNLLRPVGPGRLQCAVHGRCILIESKDHAFIISSLDPIKGKGVELARTPVTSLRILPHGDGLAYICPPDNQSVLNRVRVIPFDGSPPEEIVVKDAKGLYGLTWLPSDSGFLVTDRGKLLLVSRTGASKVLWSPEGMLASAAFSSPDEKHLAINVGSHHSNVWMLSGF